MSECARFATPQEAYEWAARYFKDGGFRLGGSATSSTHWLLMTTGGFVIFDMPKRCPR